MHRCHLSLLFVAIAVPVSAASAQAPSAPLAPVVVTATRVAAPVTAPASVSVLSGDSLRARGITHVADALRLIPGVTVVTSSSLGSQASLFVRGGQGNYVRVLVDGVPVNEPGGAVDLGALTLDNIDRIEVVRGPSSVLYGQDAVTGVIQLVSRTGGAGARLGLALDGGSFGQRGVALSGGAGNARAAFSASIADRAATGILPFNNQYRHRVAALGVQLHPDARTEATLTARWQHAVYHYPTASDGSIADRNAQNASHRLALAFAGTRRVGARLTAAWTLGASEHDPRSGDGPDSPADTVGFYGFFSRGTVTRRAADVRLSARAGARQLVTVGAELARDRERSSTRSLSEYGADAGDFTALRDTRALYVQGIGAVRTRGSYQVGARLDDNSAFGTFRTLRAGASWQLTSRWKLRGAAGRAFRAPSFFENFATGYVRGNAALTPERSSSREAGIEGQTGGATIIVVAYQQRVRDLIQYSAQTADPAAPNYVNVAGANADGVEAELSFALAAATRARASYAYTRTRVTDAGVDAGSGATFVLGQPLIRRPAHAARLEVSRALATRGALTAGAAYTGRAYDRNYAAWPAVAVTLPARTLVDVAATWRLSGSNAGVPVNARLRVDNVTNVAYDGIYGFRAPGRSLRAGLTVGRP